VGDLDRPYDAQDGGSILELPKWHEPITLAGNAALDTTCSLLLAWRVPPPPPPSAAIVNLLLKLLTLHMSVCAAAVLLCVTADPNAYAFQPENALKLKPWDHSTRDTTLLDLIPFLQMVQEVHVEVRHESSKLC